MGDAGLGVTPLQTQRPSCVPKSALTLTVVEVVVVTVAVGARVVRVHGPTARREDVRPEGVGTAPRDDGLVQTEVVRPVVSGRGPREVGRVTGRPGVAGLGEVLAPPLLPSPVCRTSLGSVTVVGCSILDPGPSRRCFEGDSEPLERPVSSWTKIRFMITRLC